MILISIIRKDAPRSSDGTRSREGVIMIKPCCTTGQLLWAGITGIKLNAGYCGGGPYLQTRDPADHCVTVKCCPGCGEKIEQLEEEF